MQYIQLQQQPAIDIPNASNGSVNLFVSNGNIILKDDNGQDIPQGGGAGNPLDAIQMELGWTSGSTLGVHGERIRLLNINTNINDILTGTTGDEVWLFIERYKGKSNKKDINHDPTVRNAGWKHDVYPDANNPDRPSEIQLTSAYSEGVYFGQDNYFNVEFLDVNEPWLGGTVGAKGLKRCKARYNSVYVYLRFRLKIGSDINGWSYTKPLAKINMMMEFNGPDGQRVLQVNYKYV